MYAATSFLHIDGDSYVGSAACSLSRLMQASEYIAKIHVNEHVDRGVPRVLEAIDHSQQSAEAQTNANHVTCFAIGSDKLNATCHVSWYDKIDMVRQQLTSKSN